MSVETYMQAVAELAAIAGENAMRYYRTPLSAETKADGSPVTIVDRSSERLVREWIERRFPADGIFGEEYGSVRTAARRRWIIDPIDGTESFIRGVPLWGCLVAVLEEDAVLAGAASYPALGETLVAARGEGCWWNESRCSVSSVDDIALATVLSTDVAFKGQPDKLRGWLTLAGAAGVSRTWGDCVGYLLVATGRAEVMADPIVSDWDVAALIPAIIEAGGVFTSWDGSANQFGGSAIATNRALAETARKMLSGRFGEETI